MTEHLSWETMNSFVDRELPVGLRDTAARHVALCRTCSDRIAKLEQMLGELSVLPRDVAVPEEAWEVVRSRLVDGKVVPLPASPVATANVRTRIRRQRWGLAAAALLLVTLTSAVTAVVLRRPPAGPSMAGATSEVAMSVNVANVERGYLDSVRELSEALSAARTHLSPQTIAIVERNLQLIDAAIGESREALLRDPGNRVLLDVLAGTYEQKLDLLRRAAQLAAS